MKHSPPPYLQSLHTLLPASASTEFPYTIPAFRDGIDIRLISAVTFLVGENGCGKSTLLEGIAESCGFNPLGGNSNHQYGTPAETSGLASDLRLTWLRKTHRGFFLRAESFFFFADYIDQLAEEDWRAYGPYGGNSLHRQSHGEAFLSLFSNKFTEGIFLLDEPEAALSPSRQLSLLVVIDRLVNTSKAQFIIATHSPILLTYPSASILLLDSNGIAPTSYEETSHFQITKNLLNNPDVYYKHLFSDIRSKGSGGAI